MLLVNLDMMKQQCFSSLKIQKKTTFEFSQNSVSIIKMETQKIINLLNDSSNEKFKFLQRNGML